MSRLLHQPVLLAFKERRQVLANSLPSPYTQIAANCDGQASSFRSACCNERLESTTTARRSQAVGEQRKRGRGLRRVADACERQFASRLVALKTRERMSACRFRSHSKPFARTLTLNILCGLVRFFSSRRAL